MLLAFIVVSLMTYLVMPRLSLLLRSWLYPVDLIIRCGP